MGQHYVVVSSTPSYMHYQLTHMCTVLSRKVVLLKQKRHTIIKFCSRLLMHRHTMGLLSNVFVVVICTCNYLPLQITLLRKDMGQYGRCGRQNKKEIYVGKLYLANNSPRKLDFWNPLDTTTIFKLGTIKSLSSSC